MRGKENVCRALTIGQDSAGSFQRGDRLVWALKVGENWDKHSNV